MLMANKMADDTLPPHLPFGLGLDLNKFCNRWSMNIMSVSCISRDNYSYKLETNQLFYFYE